MTPLTPWSPGAPPLTQVRAGTRHWRALYPRLTEAQVTEDIDRRCGGPEAAAAFAAWEPRR